MLRMSLDELSNHNLHASVKNLVVSALTTIALSAKRSMEADLIGSKSKMEIDSTELGKKVLKEISEKSKEFEAGTDAITEEVLSSLQEFDNAI